MDLTTNGIVITDAIKFVQPNKEKLTMSGKEDDKESRTRLHRRRKGNGRKRNIKSSFLSMLVLISYTIDYSSNISDHNNCLQRFSCVKCKARLLTMTLCNHCKTNQAEIFQESGEFCLPCWQERTFPNLSNDTDITLPTI
jgi:hypothetical protein